MHGHLPFSAVAVTQQLRVAIHSKHRDEKFKIIRKCCVSLALLGQNVVTCVVSYLNFVALECLIIIFNAHGIFQEYLVILGRHCLGFMYHYWSFTVVGVAIC